MLETIIEKDQQLLIYLNSLGSTLWDPFYMYITHQINWWPFFLILIFLLLKKISLKQFGLLVLVLAVFFLFTDQTTNLVKNSVERIRPVNDPLIAPYLRILRKAGSFSFFSGHASNSSGATLILFLILRKYYRYAWLLFFFPLLFAYTRIYLALHYPLDILCGYLFGLSSGFMFFSLFRFLNRKYGLKDRQQKNAFG